jgi:hypothetical protein
MDAIVKSSSTRRRKKDGIDLEQMADQEIEDMRRRMAQAAEADNEGRKRGEPARHKLKLLPEVVALLNKSNLKESIVDPESNILEAVRFFLEPLSDGSLPAYDIQKELFAALGKLPINKDTLVASGIGKVIMFYIKSKRPELIIKRQAERLFTDWTRPILRRTDDYRKKEFAQADYDPTYVTRTLLSRAPANPLSAAKSHPATQLPTVRPRPAKPRRNAPSKPRAPSSAPAWKPALPPTQSPPRATSSSTRTTGIAQATSTLCGRYAVAGVAAGAEFSRVESSRSCAAFSKQEQRQSSHTCIFFFLRLFLGSAGGRFCGVNLFC